MNNKIVELQKKKFDLSDFAKNVPLKKNTNTDIIKDSSQRQTVANNSTERFSGSVLF